MATKRTPLQTTEKVLRKQGGLKQIALYQKRTMLSMTGEPSEIQTVMADVHQFIGSHPLVVGGKTKRKVHVIAESTTPTKIFDGVA